MPNKCSYIFGSFGLSTKGGSRDLKVQLSLSPAVYIGMRVFRERVWGHYGMHADCRGPPRDAICRIGLNICFV